MGWMKGLFGTSHVSSQQGGMKMDNTGITVSVGADHLRDTDDV